MRISCASGPSHGWATIKKETLREILPAAYELAVQAYGSRPFDDWRELISAYSYTTLSEVFLEEDTDLSTFTSACRWIGIDDIELNTRHIEKEGRYRAQQSYHPALMDVNHIYAGDVLVNSNYPNGVSVSAVSPKHVYTNEGRMSLNSVLRYGTQLIRQTGESVDYSKPHQATDIQKKFIQWFNK